MSLLRREATPAAGGGMDGGDRPRCRRRLFADEDDDDVDAGDDDAGQPGATDNLVNVLQEEMRRARDAAKQRWNFDFENERPLDGLWEWEAVEAAPGGGVQPPPSQQAPPERQSAPPPPEDPPLDTPPSR